MKIAVVGNRYGWNIQEIYDVLECNISKEDEIVSGGAIGVDTYANKFAEYLGIPITIFYPDNSKPSPKRYYDRNQDIVDYSDILIAFQDNPHRSGTQSSINRARKKGIKVIVIKKGW